VAARSKAWAFGRALAGIVGSNPTESTDVCLFWVFECCQVEVSATDWSVVQRSPTECGVSECDLQTSKRRRPRPDRGCCATGKKMFFRKTVPTFVLQAYIQYPRNRLRTGELLLIGLFRTTNFTSTRGRNLNLHVVTVRSSKVPPTSAVIAHSPMLCVHSHQFRTLAVRKKKCSYRKRRQHIW
jgi:hypothetical protein